MTPLHVCFWLCAACVVYTYALYPLLLAVLARWRARPLCSRRPRPRSVSLVVAAYNEEDAIGRRVAELTGLIRTAGLEGEVIVVSDGSTDATAAAARSPGDGPVFVLELPERLGKAAAVTEACKLAVHEVLVFADTRQRWTRDTLPLLLENFTDPSVGAVSGDLVMENAPGLLAGVDIYWRFEKWLRHTESRLHSMVGVTGAVSAVRRHLFRPIPRGIILDDVYWPLQVAMQGFRVVHDTRAHAYDRLPGKVRDEFRRKVRTLSGNFQLLSRLPTALLPWRNPICWQLLSHKLLRLAVPWALLGLLVSTALLPGALYQVIFWSQVTCYALAVVGLCPAAPRLHLVSLPASFLVLNGAAWLAFWVWCFGRADGSWRKVAYERPPCGVPANP